MDYIRKKRWVKYRHSKCKMYLRNDFHYECAYCKLREKDIGVLGEEYFQKDHFVAQHSETSIDLDAYDNMIYACTKCNRIKTDYKMHEILNPCEDDIFSGEFPHITVGGAEQNYLLSANTQMGQQYIELLQLNSRYHIKLREKREEADGSETELKSTIDQMDLPVEFREKVMNFLKHRYNMNLYENLQFRCGNSKAGEAFQKVITILEEEEIPVELLFDEYDIDVSIQYHGEKYYCEIKLNDSNTEQIKYIRMSDAQKEKWIESGKKCGVLYYYQKTGRLDFYQLKNRNLEFVENIVG